MNESNTQVKRWSKEMFDNQGFKHQLLEREADIAKLPQEEQDEIYNNRLRHSSHVTGFMSKEEAQKQLNSDESHLLIKNCGVGMVGDMKAYFLSDDAVWGYGILPEAFISVSLHIPSKAAPRPGLEDGFIDTVEKFMIVFGDDQRHLNTVDELVDYLNENY